MPAEQWRDLPEAQKPIYRQSPTDPSVYEYAVPTMFNSMRNAKQEREEALARAQEAERQAKIFEKFGDPSRIEDLISREQMLKDGTKSMEQAMERAKREAEEKYSQMVNDLRRENERSANARCSDYQENVISGLLAGSRVKKGYEDEVRLAIGRRLKTEIRDGRPFTYVVDEKNPNQLAQDQETFDPLTPERYFQQYRQSRGALFEGDTGDNSGAGFSNGRGGNQGSFDSDPLTWTFETKRDFLNSYGGPGSPTAMDAYNRKLQAWAKKRAEQKKAS